jgi:cytochrome c553
VIPAENADLDYIKFTGIKHNECSDCHEDIHRGKFDQACRVCHNTSSWRNVNRAEFDHGKTRYPLTGEHAALACEKCHEDGGRLGEDDAGILAGQWTPYLRWSMDDYISDKREMTKKMRKKVTKLLEEHGDAGVEQLLHFYASQK